MTMELWRRVASLDFAPPWGAEEVMGLSEDRFLVSIGGIAASDAQRAVRVDASNIGAFLVDEGGLHRGCDIARVEGALSPWDTAWLEADVPCQLADHGYAVSSIRVGILASFGDAEDWAGAAHTTRLMGMHPGEGQFGLMTLLWAKPAEGKKVAGPIYSAWVVMDGEGRVVQRDGGYAVRMQHIDARSPELVRASDEVRERHERTLELFGLMLPLFAFQFANCRNVETVEVLPTRQQRRWAERKGEPVNSHYVLRIDDATQRKVYAKDGEPVPSSKRLHICRGHFATYTEAAPLFGKLTGRFWIPAHVRGSDKHGTVSKDYAIGSAA